MKQITLLSVFLLLLFNINAQDKIITTDKDTIHCRILSVNINDILYEIKQKDGSISGKKIKMSLVSEYSVMKKNQSKSDKPKTSKNETTKWNIGFNAGKSYKPWLFDNMNGSQFENYEQLKSGINLNTQIHGMMNDNFGLGIDYNLTTSHSSQTLMGELSTPYNFISYTDVNRQYSNYLGPSVIFQQNPDSKSLFKIRETISTGVLNYRMESETTTPGMINDEYSEITTNSLLTGYSFGAKIGLSIDSKLNKDFSLGLGGSFMWSLLNRISYETRSYNSHTVAKNQKLSNPFNLLEINYGIVLRYQFN